MSLEHVKTIMQKNLITLAVKEPYRVFFPLGVLYLLWGALIWLPLLWNPGDYPVLAHRYLMLNGFSASFIGGFLMTAVPKFSKTNSANGYEVLIFLLLTLLGLLFAYQNMESFVFLVSSAQAATLLTFLFLRISKRKENPPYSFIFIFVGLILWLVSGLASYMVDSETFKRLHYEGAIAAIILGVGSRLIPGILGHVQIVMSQREKYERPVSILATVPAVFFLFILSFVASYFLDERWGGPIRALVVTVVAFKYWLLWKAPKEKTALTWCIWMAGWMMVTSFILRAFWIDGMIHGGHSFFISCIVLLSLLIGTRVLQSHGPQMKSLEQSKVLYLLTFLLILSAATRVSAYLMPESYLNHLAYSALILVVGVVIWSYKFLRYVGTSTSGAS